MLQNLSSSSKESIFFKLPTAIGDLLVQFLVLWILLYHTDMVRAVNFPKYAQPGTCIVLIISYFITIFLLGIKIVDRQHSTVSILGRALLNALLTWIFFNGLMAVIYELTLQGKLVALQLLLTALGVSLCHLGVRLSASVLRRLGKNTYSILMIGADENMASIYRTLKHPIGQKGYTIFGFFTDKTADSLPEGAPLLGTLDEADAYIQQHYDIIKEVLCCISPATNPAYVDRIVSLCEAHMLRFKFVPALDGYPKHKMQISQIGNVNVISLHDEPMHSLSAVLFKRGFDLLISGIFLVTLFPWIWLFCAIGIKLSSPEGPVLFRQKRTGYEGKEFDCLKFRSMHPSSDADTKQAVKHDSRLFPFGAFLRKTSIDELPQFINVFKGDMSIIGPRPHMLHHTEIYSELIGNYMVRHLAKPGITGWAQVNGCRGETRTVKEMKERVEKDIYYIEHWSIDLDISIFFITLWQLLFHKDEKAY